MKVKETKTVVAGRGQEGGVTQTFVRVIEVEQAPEGAEVVPDKTPLQDWTEVNN